MDVALEERIDTTWSHWKYRKQGETPSLSYRKVQRGPVPTNPSKAVPVRVVKPQPRSTCTGGKRAKRAYYTQIVLRLQLPGILISSYEHSLKQQEIPHTTALPVKATHQSSHACVNNLVVSRAAENQTANHRAICWGVRVCQSTSKTTKHLFSWCVSPPHILYPDV